MNKTTSTPDPAKNTGPSSQAMRAGVRSATFELQPTLRGELLWLRPLRDDDWQPLFAAASDPLIWEQHPAPDRYLEEVFREFFEEAMQSGGAFAVIDAKDGRIIGSTRYLGLDLERSE